MDLAIEIATLITSATVVWGFIARFKKNAFLLA
jgi:hypothetical protein